MSIRSGMIRRKSKRFAQISNRVLRDKSLSLKAKGLYSLIESYLNTEDFTLYKSFLMDECMEGETSFNNTWKELKSSGYLIQHKLKDESTGKYYYEYELFDSLK